MILLFQKLFPTACGCVANKAHITCYINDTVRHFCFKGHISSSNCKSAPFKYRSVLNYSVKEGKCLKYPILLSRYRGKQLDIVWVVRGRNSRVLRQLLLANFRATRNNKALGKALTRFLVRLKIYVEKKVREEWRGVEEKREGEGERERKKISCCKSPRCTIMAKGR